jgi:hypothetical protein
VPAVQIRLGRFTRDCAAGFWLKVSLPSRAISGGTGLCRPDCRASSDRTRPISSFLFMRPRVLAGARENPMSKNFCWKFSADWRVSSRSAGRTRITKE